MQLRLPLIVATLSITTQAKTDSNRRGSNKLCTIDLFDAPYIKPLENQWSDASPLVSDCQQILTNIKEGGIWTITMPAQSKLVQYGTCAFGVGMLHHFFPVHAKIGNQDIIDAIERSIELFAKDGKVGTKGVLSCDSLVDFPTDWGLYHN